MPPVAPASSRRGGRCLWVLLVPGALLLGACRVDTTVETRVQGRSGEVRARVVLDREAVDVLGGNAGPGATEVPPLDAGAEVEDLRRAGWSIGPARRTQSGGAVVEARKRFHRPEELGRVMDELSGRGGPLQRFRLDRRRSFTRIRYRLRGQADLRGGAAVAGFGNVSDLAGRLRGAGVDPKRVEELVIQRAATGFHLRVVVDLPGSEPTVHPVPLDRPVEIEAASQAPERTRPVLLALAGAAALAAFLVLGTGRPR